MFEFNTPLGKIKCLKESGESVSFEVAASDEKSHCRAKVYDDALEEWFSVEMEQYEISIESKDLLIGEKYVLKLYGGIKFSYGNADEYTLSNAVSSDEVSLSLGAYDPNDNEKDRQWLPVFDNEGYRVGLTPPQDYDTSRFRGYILDPLNDWSGFCFSLIDLTIPIVRFKIAWVYHTRETDAGYYRDAVADATLF